MVKQNGDFIWDVTQRREFEKLAIDTHVYLSSDREERKPARARWASALPVILGTTRYINRTKRKERMVKM